MVKDFEHMISTDLYVLKTPKTLLTFSRWSARVKAIIYSITSEQIVSTGRNLYKILHLQTDGCSRFSILY